MQTSLPLSIVVIQSSVARRSVSRYYGAHDDLCGCGIWSAENATGTDKRRSGMMGMLSDDCLGSYMDAPGLPSIHFMMSQQDKIAPVHPDFGAAFDAAVPDGIC